MGDTWHPSLSLRCLDQTAGGQVHTGGHINTGGPVNVGGPTLGEHDILAQPNAFSTSDVFSGFTADTRPTSLGIKKTHCDSNSSAPTCTTGLSSFHSNSSPGSAAGSCFTPISLHSVNGHNPFTTDYMSSSTAPTPYYPSHAPTTATAISSLPGDLSSLSPLPDVKLSEEDFHEYLQTSGSQESVLTQSIVNLLKSPTIERKYKSQTAMCWNELDGMEQRQPPPTRNGDSATSMTSTEAILVAEEHSLPAKSTRSCEVNSDSSSGVSSADTNLQLDSNSPLLSPNALLLHSPYELDDLLDPIHEPFPSLADDGEYMKRDPDLTPTDPPAEEEVVDLRPEVPVFEVRD